jgi:hypothetical protein
VAAGVALDEMERRVVQLILHVKQESVSLVVFLLQLDLLPPPLDMKRSNTFTNKKEGKGENRF